MKLETHQAPPRAATRKEWSWSYSKFKNWLQCPKRMYEVDIRKAHKDTGGEALEWGNRVHDVLAKALKSKLPLPKEMAAYQYWVDRVAAGAGELLVEQQYAITRDFQSTGYFSNDAWYRAKGDVVRLNGDVALVLDWKTGKVLEDPVQLMLMAQCIFSHYPKITHVRSSYVWLKDDCETPELFTRQEVADQWRALLPQVQAMEKAQAELNFPPNPGYLCKKYCPVVSCPFHGKGI